MAIRIRIVWPSWRKKTKEYNCMNWYEYLVLTPVRAANEVRSNVWSVMLIITGITLLLHGHDTAGNSLITGAFAVFRSSNTETAPPTAPPPISAAAVQDPNAK